MDREEEQTTESLPAPSGNRWYFYLPLLLVGLWALEAVAWGILYFVAPDAEPRVRSMAGPTSAVALLLEVGEWVGILAWTSLSIFYFVLLSRKRASGWWALGGLCLGVNLLLYVALLFRRPRGRAWPPLATLPTKRFGWTKTSTGVFLKDSFACESCAAVLNHGVSECSECGELYRYREGKPEALGDDE